MIQESAILAGGCFWGVQSVFDSLPGVMKTEVGYIGGTTQNPTYADVCTDLTGHAEALKITFDSEKISFNELLDVFFQSHNPTTKNRQGVDRGTQYRSAVFYLNESQKQAAEEKIKEYQPFFKNPIVTTLEKAGVFYPAEEYHQKYFEKQGQTSCFHDTNAFDKEAYYRAKMTPARYEVMRQKGTERPFSGKYTVFNENGTYFCGACGQPLFDADSKFDSSCGWPSFDKALPQAVHTKLDLSHFMIRNEVVCARCGSHLGHLFPDGPTATGNRYCINSVALDFKKKQ